MRHAFTSTEYRGDQLNAYLVFKLLTVGWSVDRKVSVLSLSDESGEHSSTPKRWKA